MADSGIYSRRKLAFHFLRFAASLRTISPAQALAGAVVRHLRIAPRLAFMVGLLLQPRVTLLLPPIARLMPF